MALDRDQVVVIADGMAITTIRSTYALDVDTVRALERMARRWNVSKSEALRRAIRNAEKEGAGSDDDALDALDKLQRSLKLTPARARAWATAVRTERHGSAEQRARRWR
jgi:hypothetical protein